MAQFTSYHFRTTFRDGTTTMRYTATLLPFLLCFCSILLHAEGFVQLLPNQWEFEKQTDGQGFSICFTFTPAADAKLLEVPGVLTVGIVDGRRPGDDYGQNYTAFPLADGSIPVLEAVLSYRLPTEGHPVEKMRVGVPLSRLYKPWSKHQAVLSYTGARLTLYIDGQLMDNDFPFGEPTEAIEKKAFIVNKKAVSKWRLVQPALEAVRDAKSNFRLRLTEGKNRRVPLQYFTPEGHNAWVGDVAAIHHNGRYHLFYLFDRRGHRSKFGRGGHYFEHLSTADFLHWTEHEAAVPIDEQWETIGTGTPFVLHDSLFLSYGMHTSRLYPNEATATPMQWDSIRALGHSVALPFSELSGCIPSGASYSTSTDTDGNQFRKSHILIHPAENPTIYTNDEGQLMMLANYGARGTWTSDRLDGGWRQVSEDFPPGGDCTFIFRWGSYEYIVGGFTHMWMKPVNAPIEAYQDMVSQGLDFYDGLSVPSITPLPDGRYVMAGWVEINRHWGGPLVIRELLQDADGRLGSRLMPELMPEPAGQKRLLCQTINDGESWEGTCSETSFLLTCDVLPDKDGKVVINLMDDSGRTCPWTLDLSEATARFGEGRSLRQGGEPQHATDYAIEHLRGIESSFPLRIIVKGDPKLGGSLVDMEIAGRRTMISHRSGLFVHRMTVAAEHVTISNLCLTPL